jgi:hypothetical protein
MGRSMTPMKKSRLDPRRIEVIEDEIAEALRGKSMAETVAMIGECNETMKLLIETHIRWTHPDWRDEQVRAEVVRRMLDEAN